MNECIVNADDHPWWSPIIVIAISASICCVRVYKFYQKGLCDITALDTILNFQF